MEISQNLYQSMINCKWFENCGVIDSCTYNFEVYIVKTLKQAVKSICSMTWENTFLEADGEISGYLFTFHNKEYNEYWNKEVNIIKETYLPPILDKINKTIEEKNYSKELIPYVSYNILDILIADFYSDFYDSVFFNNLLEIYLSGHIPCGWKGKYPEGKIMIY